ncbi:ABC transporter substrate-binding protein [Embleya hyalina]|uniref:ABC transporter substrate-binding protein n=1 Tax=Embleya hyalina TaxID=516124 RepID=A0A401YEY3_9ACTN|nr:ABC transporter substrate-binding protein [Embleya hyalina]GCD93127.1 ABC transporter substrate-binding protein [Embleya hyalina]
MFESRSPAPALGRRQFLRFTGALGAAAAIGTSLAACGPESTNTGNGSSGGKGGAKKSINAGLSYTLSTGFDPMSASGALPVAANMHVFEGLVDLDPVTRSPYAALAAAMPQQVDATTWRAKVRPGATFHDGSPVTAEDVAFSFQRVLDPANNSLISQFLPFLREVRVVDADTVEFALAFAFALFGERISVVKIVPKAVVTRDRQRFDALPVGSGPYRMVSATKDDRIVFAEHTAYNGPKPARAATMNWLLLADASARVTALDSDRVQVVEDVPYINYAQVKKAHRADSVQSFGLLFLMFNLRRKPFDDVRVRQALHWGLDKEKLIATGLLGNATPASSFLQETHPDYRRAATVYGYDPARAKSLLAEAGVSGLDLTLVLTDTAWVKDIAPLIKESWDGIGVRTTLDIGQSGGQYKNKIDNGEYQVMAAPGDPSVFGNDVDLLMRWWYVGLWADKRHMWAQTPEGRQARTLLDAAAAEADTVKRKQLWGQAIDLAAAQVPLYPVFHRKLATAWNDKALTGFRPLPTTGLSFLDAGPT